jgi:PHP family Zn ribbon phosphoesterase
LDLTEEELRSFMDDHLVEGILQVRRGLVQIKPGYDGVYGQVKIFENEAPPPEPSAQLNLF